MTQDVPTVLYDNQCYLCMKFAKTVNFIARGRVVMVGHYTTSGEKIREKIPCDTMLDMFWFIDKKRAYGGRAALIPLARTIFSGKAVKTSACKIDEQCQKDCKTIKAVFVRSSSILTNSKVVDL